MRFFKAVGVCSLFILFYYVVSVVLYIFIGNSVWSTVFSDVIVALFAFLYYKNHHKRNTDVIYSKGIVFGFLIFMVCLWFFTQITTVFINSLVDDTYYESYKELSSSDSWAYVLLTFFVAPIVEELLLRGIVYDTLKRVVPIGFAYVVSSVVFALMHGTIIHLFLAFCAGFLFAVVYEYTGRLYYSMIFHSIFNMMSVFCGGIELPEVLFEPAVFISIDALLIFVLVVASYYVWKSRCLKTRLK